MENKNPVNLVSRLPSERGLQGWRVLLQVQPRLPLRCLSADEPDQGRLHSLPQRNSDAQVPG